MFVCNNDEMEIVSFVVDFILNIDTHLGQIISTYGFTTYFILFIIVFLETGLVFTPFLPGDSLLFAAGAFAALGSLHIFVLFVILTTAAILGDTVNYWIGHFFGQKIIAHPRIPIDETHIKETQKFFHRHGGKTIILARFMPFVRTFAPFVAGIGNMDYRRFLSYNVVGGVLWVTIAAGGGFLFGNIPVIREHFSIFIFIIIIISLFPLFAGLVKKRIKGKK